MDEHGNNKTTRTSGINTWRAGCGESRTSGSEGGPEKPSYRKIARALRLDPYTNDAMLRLSRSHPCVKDEALTDTGYVQFFAERP